MRMNFKLEMKKEKKNANMFDVTNSLYLHIFLLAFGAFFFFLHFILPPPSAYKRQVGRWGIQLRSSCQLGLFLRVWEVCGARKEPYYSYTRGERSWEVFEQRRCSTFMRFFVFFSTKKIFTSA